MRGVFVFCLCFAISMCTRGRGVSRPCDGGLPFQPPLAWLETEGALAMAGGSSQGEGKNPQGDEADLPDGGEKAEEEQEQEQEQPQGEEADLPDGGEKTEEEQEQEQPQGDETDLPDGGEKAEEEQEQADARLLGICRRAGRALDRKNDEGGVP